MKKNIITVTILILVILIGYYFYNSKNINSTQLEYRDNEYGFTFTLPMNWKGYSIISNSWEGFLLDSPKNEKINGPEIFIRHPLWTIEKQRQDIPIMIFTYEQWNLVRQEKLSLGAAPIGPSELGRNSKYVFALPARYNFAFPLGFEEVINILDSKPLHT